MTKFDKLERAPRKGDLVICWQNPDCTGFSWYDKEVLLRKGYTPLKLKIHCFDDVDPSIMYCEDYLEQYKKSERWSFIGNKRCYSFSVTTYNSSDLEIILVNNFDCIICRKYWRQNLDAELPNPDTQM